MQGLSRLLGVLRALAAGGHARMRLTDVARASGLSKATAMRLLRALAAEGVVEAYDQGKSWRLGAELAYLGLSAARHAPLPGRARPHLQWLAAETGDTCYLTMRSGDDSVCVDRVHGPYPIQALTIEVGSRRPLGTGAGSLALLSALPPDEAESIILRNTARMAGYPRATADALRLAVGQAAQAGYAYTESHLVAGVNAVGLAVRDASGRPLAAITISAIAARFADNRIAFLARKLREAAARIARDLEAPR